MQEPDFKDVDKSKVYEIAQRLNQWIEKKDYTYIECNHIPSFLRTKYHKINVIFRTFFKLFPFDVRCLKDEDYIVTPQTCVSLLKAYSEKGDIAAQKRIYERILRLRSSKTKNFALSQAIPIAVQMYQNSKDDPTPLNTVWFGEYVLTASELVIKSQEKKELLLSISEYIVQEVGYKDYEDKGIYFYYGPTLNKEIYNASCVMSAFLIKVGQLYGINRYVILGERGIKYIISVQNFDGSWFYAGSPSRKSIDNFHMSYILQALISVSEGLSFNIKEEIQLGISYYYTLFSAKGKYIVPIRYDRRYIPHNTWLFFQYDGRDVSEALLFFSKFHRDEKMIDGLINLMYDRLYNSQHGYLSAGMFVYGKNRIPYMEYQGWYLNSLEALLNHLL